MMHAAPVDTVPLLASRLYRTALPSHFSHHRLRPITASLPSSFPSLPSGSPMIVANAQNPAATQADADIHTA